MASYDGCVNIHQLAELTIDNVLVLLGPDPIGHVIMEALTTFEDIASADPYPCIRIITVASAAQATRHWILNSGATTHITSSVLQFTRYKQIVPIPLGVLAPK